MIRKKPAMNQAPDETARHVSHFPVSVILERRPAASPWANFTWSAAGITVGHQVKGREARLVREEGDIACFAVGDLIVALYVDECESYYFNLVSDSPRAYVVAHPGEEDACPQPFLISMSFDEAHAYLEGEDEVYAVDVPGELYRWTEAFVLANYFPEKKRKRKLRDWSAEESGTKDRRP